MTAEEWAERIWEEFIQGSFSSLRAEIATYIRTAEENAERRGAEAEREACVTILNELSDRHWRLNGEIRSRPYYDENESCGDVAHMEASLAAVLVEAAHAIRAHGQTKE